MKTQLSPYSGINMDMSAKRTVKTEAEEEALPAADENPYEQEHIEEEPAHKVSITKGDERAEEAGAAKANVKLEDDSASLTRRLVSAKVQMQVSEIQGKASKNIADIMLAAAMSQDKEVIAQAKAIVRKLRKVVNRCQRKNRDLGKEESLRLQAQRVQKQKEIEKKREIERELKERKLERKNREEGYLREKDNCEIEAPGDKLQSAGLTAAEKAQIEMQASMMAAMEMAAGSGSDGTVDAAAGVSGGDTGGGNFSGAEVSAGTEVSGGSVDATV